MLDRRPLPEGSRDARKSKIAQGWCAQHERWFNEDGDRHAARTLRGLAKDKKSGKKKAQGGAIGERASLGPKATAPITVIRLSPDLTLGVSSKLQCNRC